MNYKLINKTTNEETICTKVVVDGFEYYITQDKVKLGCHIYDVLDGRIWKVTNEHCFSAYFEQDCVNWRTVIATNNPSIDVPKVLDEVGELSPMEKMLEDESYVPKGTFKSQETHPYNQDDLIEFAEFTCKEYFNSEWQGSIEELMEIWKEQKTKTIYYESN